MNHFPGDTSKYVAAVLLLTGMFVGVLAIDRSDGIIEDILRINVSGSVSRAAPSTGTMTVSCDGLDVMDFRPPEEDDGIDFSVAFTDFIFKKAGSKLDNAILGIVSEAVDNYPGLTGQTPYINDGAGVVSSGATVNSSGEPSVVGETTIEDDDDRNISLGETAIGYKSADGDITYGSDPTYDTSWLDDFNEQQREAVKEAAEKVWKESLAAAVESFIAELEKERPSSDDSPSSPPPPTDPVPPPLPPDDDTSFLKKFNLSVETTDYGDSTLVKFGHTHYGNPFLLPEVCKGDGVELNIFYWVRSDGSISGPAGVGVTMNFERLGQLLGLR